MGELTSMAEPTSEPTAADRLRTLQHRHSILKEQVKELERRAYLTPPEQRQIADLKKLKLAAKDQIYALRRDSLISERS
jgi:hypothetical protein